MKLVDKLRLEMVGEIFAIVEIDCILEKEKFYPVENDEEMEEGILKYTNGASQIWLKYIREQGDFLVESITRSTKKRGKDTKRAFRTFEEIKGMMDYFRNNALYDEFLIFILGLLLARRIGDTLTLKWSDFYYENGRKKENLRTLIEEKTEKIVDIGITKITLEYIDWYCEIKNISPMKHYKEDIFQKRKSELSKNYTQKQYDAIIDKQAKAYRYVFKKAAEYNGIEDVSTHSTRKSFGRIAYEINKYDPDCLPTLQTIFAHDSIETTKIYIDIIPEKATKIFNDVAQRIYDIDNGIKPAIDNVPVITLKTNELRNILIQAYRYGQNGVQCEMDTLNQLLSLVEDKRIS